MTQSSSSKSSNSKSFSSKSFRSWQKEALEVYVQAKLNNKKSILWEATPGAGKTFAAMNLCLKEKTEHQASRIIIVVPTTHLKLQWARAAAEFDIHLDINYEGKQKSLSKDYHGAILTYQQIGSNPSNFKSLANNAVTVLDEVHHAGDGLTWGNSLKLILKNASFILCLSGTAFRSDANPIPFIKYTETGVSEPDYAYTYSSAVSDRVCRPTVFFTYGGEVAWQENGTEVNVTFTDALEKTGKTKRLRAALDPASGWIEPMLKEADTMLTAVREEHPQAGALLVASNQKHAKEFAKILRAVTGEKAVTILSEDPTANKKLKEYSAGDSRWLIACNMVSEGVDIPRLRVGVFATTTRTKMYFRQFLGRIVRKTKTPKGVQTAFFYLPADPWLKKLAEEIELEQRHFLKNIDNEYEFAPLDEGTRENKKEEDNEFSWRALRSTNSGLESVISSGGQLSFWDDNGDSNTKLTSSLEQIVIDKENDVKNEASAPEASLSKAELKEEIAKEIRTLVTRYHRNSGQPHSHIHALLNRTQGLKSQNQCTEVQLKERLGILEKLVRSDIKLGESKQG